MQRLWADTEHELRLDGVSHAAQVFTDSFDFYFVSVRSPRSWDYRPRSTGGWAQIDLYGYDRVHPPLPRRSLAEFLDHATAHGVSHLVLTPTAGFVRPELGAFQSGAELPAGLRHVAAIGAEVRIIDIRHWRSTTIP